MDTNEETTGQANVDEMSTVYKQPKLQFESDYEKRVRRAIAQTAQQLRQSGMDAVKAEILALRLAVKHERENGRR